MQPSNEDDDMTKNTKKILYHKKTKQVFKIFSRGKE